MERLIRHHAARGTKVRIMVTDILEREKDGRCCAGSPPTFPTSSCRNSPGRPTGAPIGEQLSQLHKTHHVKMLATVAATRAARAPSSAGATSMTASCSTGPSTCRAIRTCTSMARPTGSRSTTIPTGATSRSSSPSRRRSDAHRASGDTVAPRRRHRSLRPFSIPEAAGGRPARTKRHFMSVPYADGRALKDYYVELIDAAEDNRNRQSLSQPDAGAGRRPAAPSIAA